VRPRQRRGRPTCLPRIGYTYNHRGRSTCLPRIGYTYNHRGRPTCLPRIGYTYNHQGRPTCLPRIGYTYNHQGRPTCLPRIGYTYNHRGRHVGLPLLYTRLHAALIVNCFHCAIARGARQIFSFIFQFSIFHITFVIYHCRSRLVRAAVYDKRNMENETAKAPPSVVHLSLCATIRLARPAIIDGNDELFDPEIFPAKRDLHRHAIQRERAFDRQRGVYLSWRPRQSVLEGAGVRLEHQTCSTPSSSVGATGL